MTDQYIPVEESDSASEISLQDIPDFPYDTFQKQRASYRQNEMWVSGQALSQQSVTGTSTEEIDLYPLRINPLPATIQKHVAVLFGEPEDDGRAPVYTKFVIGDNEEEKQAASIAEEYLNDLWWENNGREAMMVNGFMSHVYGGCIFKASYVPWEINRRFPFRIDTINPKNFVAYPNGGDRFRLSEAWYAKEIRKSEARNWGYTGEEEVVWYVEKWLLDEYQVLIDGKPAKVRFPGVETDFTVGGKNPFGFVPFVYIPHIRLTEFLGIPIAANLKGLIKELNLRYGDYGDAVNDDSHSMIAMRNTVNPKMAKIGKQEVADLGNKSGLTTGEGEPDMWEVNTKKASSAMKDLLHAIWDQYRRDAFVPAVADGEDEGSQRSGLTLAIRFWPLTSHVNLERMFWSAGLDIFQGYLLKMALLKKPKETQITEKHLQMRMKQKWASMLPRDREIDVAEWVNRASNNLASIETLLEKAGDVDSIPEERERILAWVTELAQIEADAAAEAAQKFPQPQFGQSSGSGNSGGGQQK